MKIKRIKKLQVNCYTFNVKWNKKSNGARFDYHDKILEFGVAKDVDDSFLLMLVCHELMELAAIELNVRLYRPDCDDDYIFVYDHRQHDSMMNLFASLLQQFLE